MGVLRQLGQTALLTLYPPKCYFCGGILDEDVPICQQCKAKLPVTNETNRIQYGDHFSRCYSYCLYDTLVKHAFHRYKFGGCYHYSKLFGAWLAGMCLASDEPAFDLLTWVPLHPFRKWKRGYDQAELLAQEMGLYLGIKPVKTLRKVRNTTAQSELLSSEQRYQNVKNAYRLLTQDAVRDKHVLLIDDVITTGATLENAAAALQAGGAAEVVCMTLARSQYGSS